MLPHSERRELSQCSFYSFSSLIEHFARAADDRRRRQAPYRIDGKLASDKRERVSDVDARNETSRPFYRLCNRAKNRRLNNPSLIAVLSPRTRAPAHRDLTFVQQDEGTAAWGNEYTAYGAPPPDGGRRRLYLIAFTWVASGNEPKCPPDKFQGDRFCIIGVRNYELVETQLGIRAERQLRIVIQFQLCLRVGTRS